MKVSASRLSSILLFVPLFFALPNGAPQLSTPDAKIEYGKQNEGAEIAQSISTGNWGGIALESPPPGTNFTAIIGTFAVPNPTPPVTNFQGNWSGAAWVGLDGLSAASLFQAGITWTVSVDSNQNVTTKYAGVYEWVPGPMGTFEHFEMSAGDIITVLCEASSASSGVCSIHNQNTKVTASQIMSSPESGPFLLGQSAEWIVEDIDSADGFLPFANFRTVAWTNCLAATKSIGDATAELTTLSPNDSTNITMFTILQSQGYLTSTVISGDNITINYAGKF